MWKKKRKNPHFLWDISACPEDYSSIRYASLHKMIKPHRTWSIYTLPFNWQYFTHTHTQTHTHTHRQTNKLIHNIHAKYSILFELFLSETNSKRSENSNKYSQNNICISVYMLKILDQMKFINLSKALHNQINVIVIFSHVYACLCCNIRFYKHN